MPEGPGTLMVGSLELASDSEARASEMAVTDAVATVLSDVPSAQPVESMVLEKSSQTALLTPGDFCDVVEGLAPTCMPAPPRLLTPPILPPSSNPAFCVPTMLVVHAVWPLLPMGLAPSILASAPSAALVSMPQDPLAMANAPPGLAP